MRRTGLWIAAAAGILAMLPLPAGAQDTGPKKVKTPSGVTVYKRIAELKIIDEGIISHEPGRGAYMPVITLLPDGTFLACQHVGLKLGSSDNHIEVLRSTDECKTWINEGSIHTHTPEDEGWAYRGPGVSVVPDGRLVMKNGEPVRKV